MKRSLIVETQYAILQHARVPSQFFGIPVGGIIAFAALVALGVNISEDWLIRLAVLGVINVGVFGVANNVVTERLMGWDKFQKATPMRPWVYLLSRKMLGVAMSLLLVIVLPVVGYFTEVHFNYTVWVSIVVLLSVGSIVFTSFGLALAYSTSPQAAQMALAYGGMVLLLPVFLQEGLLPSWIQALLALLPSKHFVDLVLAVAATAGSSFSMLSAVWLLVLTVLFTLAAQRLFLRDET